MVHAQTTLHVVLNICRKGKAGLVLAWHAAIVNVTLALVCTGWDLWLPPFDDLLLSFTAG